MKTLDPVLQHRARIAVVGAGVAGLGAAWALRDVHDVTLFEAEDRLGGHANTVTIDHDGRPIDVDTGFIVFNTLNYPNLTALFEHLGVDSFRSDMSFGFSLGPELEWCSNGLKGLFAQPANLFRPRFLGMLREILRFNRVAPRDLEAGALRGLALGDYLDQAGFGARFRENYLLARGAAIWSSTEADMAAYPAEAFVRFFKNHRLMNMKRPKWRTVVGGSRVYIRRIAQDLEAAGVEYASGARSVRRIGDGVEITDAEGRTRRFDEVIHACHSDQALRLLADADYDERELLGAIPYAPNEAVLHRDQSLLPRREAARAAWCYLREGDRENAAVTYDMNRLQGIDPACPLFVTLNPSRQPEPGLTFARFEYDHPQFTAAGMAAQRIFNRVQGVRNTWFAGAWLGYGFHEDGLRSGLRAALKLGGRIPWDFVEGDIDGGAFGARPDYAAAALMTAAE